MLTLAVGLYVSALPSLPSDFAAYSTITLLHDFERPPFLEEDQWLLR